MALPRQTNGVAGSRRRARTRRDGPQQPSARKGAQNARKRRLRAEDEADDAVKASDALLKRLGKTRIGGPGNRQTRAALNYVNVRKYTLSRSRGTGVEPPPSDGGGKPHFHSPRTGAE